MLYSLSLGISHCKPCQKFLAQFEKAGNFLQFVPNTINFMVFRHILDRIAMKVLKEKKFDWNPSEYHSYQLQGCVVVFGFQLNIDCFMLAQAPSQLSIVTGHAGHALGEARYTSATSCPTWATCLATSCLGTEGLAGGHRRRIGDVGGDWCDTYTGLALTGSYNRPSSVLRWLRYLTLVLVHLRLRRLILYTLLSYWSIHQILYQTFTFLL